MANDKKRSLDDLANGEKSETNGTQVSVNAGSNNAMQLKKDHTSIKQTAA